MTSSIWGLAKTNPAPAADSAVDFPTRTRFHIALNVRKVDAILPFYKVLFGVEPHTVREGYAKFDLREPPLNFSLNEVPKNARGNGSFGIEAKSGQVLADVARRLQAAAIAWDNTAATGSRDMEIHVTDPEGNTWRFYSESPAPAPGSVH
jgi:catechol-2,3-dioxygenase